MTEPRDRHLAALDQVEDLLEAYAEARLAPAGPVLSRMRAHVLAQAAAAAAVQRLPVPDAKHPSVLARLEPWAPRRAVALARELVNPLGELSPLVTRTGFDVHPCIARVPADTELIVDTREFDSVFMSSLELFADRDLFRLEAMSDGVRTRMVPHYQVGDDNIWGVTAAVLAQLANLAYDAGLDLQRNWTKKP